MAPIADISLGDVFLSVLWFCGLFLWISLALMVFFDLFRDHELSGWAKAAWTVFVIVLPLLGVLTYLVVRGEHMRERAAREQREQEAAMRDYVQRLATPAATPADDLAKLVDLQERGVISADELARAREKLLA